MTIKGCLELAIIKLKKEIKNPHLEAEILLSNILKKSREFILSHSEYNITKRQNFNLQSQIKRRLKKEPIAYLTGHKEFYNLDFNVNKNVLIPRPETELIVEEALKLITRNTQQTTIIDIGTGSGCIIITLAKLLDLKSKIINHELFGIDISKKALMIAKQNSKIHQINKNIKFLNGNLLKPILNKTKNLNLKSKILILANLPYLTPTQIKNSPSIKYEPKKALNGGKDGLEIYKKLFEQINKLKIKNHKLMANNYILCEINPSQTNKIKLLIKKYLPQSKLQIKKDLATFNRLIIITF